VARSRPPRRGGGGGRRGVAAIVSVATGWGLHWVSASLFSTPARVRLAITPSTGTAWTLSSLLNDVGVQRSSTTSSRSRALVGGDRRSVRVVDARANAPGQPGGPVGLALLALAFGGPAAWPWSSPGRGAAHRHRLVPTQPRGPIAIVVAAFLVKPNGILLLPLQSAPYVVLVYLLIAAGAWYAWTAAAPV